MLVKTIDVADGAPMSAFEVDPQMLPRTGEEIAMGENGVTWKVERVVWSGHPLKLEPTLHLATLGYR